MTVAAAAALRLSGHPLQRCGVRAATQMAERDEPGQVSDEDLKKVAAKITDDAVAAATADKGSTAYDWWKLLFALFPNSKPTHARRPKQAEELRPEVAALLEPDSGRGVAHPCTFCIQTCTVLWTKSTLPMFDSDKALNTLPPGLAGWPVCWGCRVAMWALPYGAWCTPGSITVLTSDDPAVEGAFVARSLLRAERVRQGGFARLPSGRGPEPAAARALLSHARYGGAAGATLWLFKNDNQEPWLRVSGMRGGVVMFLQRVQTEQEYRWGWAHLRRVMERRDASDAVTLDGTTAAARTLFDPDLEPADRLLGEFWRRAHAAGDPSSPMLRRWGALAALYMEVMYGVETHELKPVAEVLAHWIKKESSRGRFNEYRQAAGSGYLLGRLLMQASARQMLDHDKPPVLRSDTLAELSGTGGRRWQLRLLLWFQVLEELHHLGVSLRAGDDEEESPEDEKPMRHDEDLFPEDEEYA